LKEKLILANILKLTRSTFILRSKGVALIWFRSYI